MVTKTVLRIQCLRIIIVVLLTCCNADANNVSSSNYSEENVLEKCQRFGIFYDLQSLLNQFQDPKWSEYPQVKELESIVMLMYKEDEQKKDVMKRRHPFIAVEGTKRSRRKILANMIANNIGAFRILGMPKCVRYLRGRFDATPELKAFFFACVLYLNSVVARSKAEVEPVLIEGYWMETAAYHMAKEYVNELPPIGSDLYKLPTYLFRPDIVFFFNTIAVEKDPKYIDFTNRTAEIYRRMREPSVYEIHKTFISGQDMYRIRVIIREQLTPKFKHIEYL